MGAFTADEGRFHCLHPSACCRERVWAGTFSFTSWTWGFLTWKNYCARKAEWEIPCPACEVNPVPGGSLSLFSSPGVQGTRDFVPPPEPADKLWVSAPSVRRPAVPGRERIARTVRSLQPQHRVLISEARAGSALRRFDDRVGRDQEDAARRAFHRHCSSLRVCRGCYFICCRYSVLCNQVDKSLFSTQLFVQKLFRVFMVSSN